jgi:hypothetical protein
MAYPLLIELVTLRMMPSCAFLPLLKMLNAAIQLLGVQLAAMTRRLCSACMWASQAGVITSLITHTQQISL